MTQVRFKVYKDNLNFLFLSDNQLQRKSDEEISEI